MNRRLLATALALGLVASFAVAPGALAAKKKKPKAVPCAAYVPGEQGADAGDTIIVNDVATEEMPLEMEVEAHPGLAPTDPDDPTAGHAFYNIQVDTNLPETGLYVRLEFDNLPPVRDYDLWLNYPDGSNASNAHGFNPAPDSMFSPKSDGGHTETNAEQIDGTHTPDCQGYTLDVATSTGEGGTLTLKMWLGEIQYHPAG